MIYTIYKITNKINGKFYIGMHKTTNLDDGYMGSGVLISRAIKKYGIENFSKEILHIFDNEEDMIAKEKELVVISEQTYNIAEGGKGGFSYINKNDLSDYSAAARKAGKIARDRFKSGVISDGHWWFTKEGIKKRSVLGKESLRRKHADGGWTFSGKSHSDQTREKMKKSAVGKHNGEKNSQYGTVWITNGQENRKIKAENLDKWLKLGYYRGRSTPRSPL